MRSRMSTRCTLVGYGAIVALNGMKEEAEVCNGAVGAGHGSFCKPFS